MAFYISESQKSVAGENVDIGRLGWADGDWLHHQAWVVDSLATINHCGATRYARQCIALAQSKESISKFAQLGVDGITNVREANNDTDDQDG